LRPDHNRRFSRRDGSPPSGQQSLPGKDRYLEHVAHFRRNPYRVETSVEHGCGEPLFRSLVQDLNGLAARILTGE
jgi:hypothetical protein